MDLRNLRSHSTPARLWWEYHIPIEIFYCILWYMVANPRIDHVHKFLELSVAQHWLCVTQIWETSTTASWRGSHLKHAYDLLLLPQRYIGVVTVPLLNLLWTINKKACIHLNGERIIAGRLGEIWNSQSQEVLFWVTDFEAIHLLNKKAMCFVISKAFWTYSNLEKWSSVYHVK